MLQSECPSRENARLKMRPESDRIPRQNCEYHRGARHEWIGLDLKRFRDVYYDSQNDIFWCWYIILKYWSHVMAARHFSVISSCLSLLQTKRKIVQCFCSIKWPLEPVKGERTKASFDCYRKFGWNRLFNRIRAKNKSVRWLKPRKVNSLPQQPANMNGLNWHKTMNFLKSRANSGFVARVSSALTQPILSYDIFKVLLFVSILALSFFFVTLRYLKGWRVRVSKRSSSK